MDGLHIVRTSLSAAQADAPTCVRSYKALANVERALRSIKTTDLKVRPVHHRLADRVRAQIFLCKLADYVELHLREAWRELMFADTEQQAKTTRDPVAPAIRSDAALAKAHFCVLTDGTPAHSVATLMAELATLVRNICRACLPFLECGILVHGFLRLRCGDCGHEKLVAFSCKRRGFCPSCGARRMAQTAAHPPSTSDRSRLRNGTSTPA